MQKVSILKTIRQGVPPNQDCRPRAC